MAEKYSNFATSTLASGITSGDTSVTLVDGSKFPSTGDFRVLLESELVKCTARSGNVLTIVRAQESTSAASHASGVVASNVLTSGALTALQLEYQPSVTAVSSFPYTISSVAPIATFAITLTGDSAVYLPDPTVAGQRIHVKRVSGLGRIMLSTSNTTTLMDGVPDGRWVSDCTVYTDGTGYYVDQTGTVVADRFEVTGGSTTLTAHSCFSNETRAWSTAAALGTNRYSHASMRAYGMNYVLDGYNTVALNSVARHLATTDAWANMTGDSTSRSWPRGALIGTSIYLAAGFTTVAATTNNAYSVSGDSWTTKTVMTAGRYAMGAYGAANTLYCVGGSDNAGTMQATHYAYSVSGNSWSTKTSATVSRGYWTSIPWTASYAVMAGYNGSAGTQDHIEYGINSDAWISRASYPVAVWRAVGSRLGNGAATAAGTTSSNVYFFEPLTNTFYTQATTSTTWEASGGANV